MKFLFVTILLSFLFLKSIIAQECQIGAGSMVASQKSVGTWSLSSDNTQFIFRFNMTGWRISKMNLFLGDKNSGIPTIAPGQYPFQATANRTRSLTYTALFSQVGGAISCGSDVKFAVRLKRRERIRRTAWAFGASAIRFPVSNGGWYFIETLCCPSSGTPTGSLIPASKSPTPAPPSNSQSLPASSVQVAPSSSQPITPSNSQPIAPSSTQAAPSSTQAAPSSSQPITPSNTIAPSSTQIAPSSSPPITPSNSIAPSSTQIAPSSTQAIPSMSSTPTGSNLPTFETQSNNTVVPIFDNTASYGYIPFATSRNITGISIVVNITHTYSGDLNLDLIAPDATLVNLQAPSGNATANIIQTYDLGTTPGLSVMNGKNVNGIWTLNVTDTAGGDVGTLDFWIITVQY